MVCLKTSLICLVLVASVKRSQAQDDPPGYPSLSANISVAEAVAGASDAKHWMQMQNSGRTSGSRCSDDKGRCDAASLRRCVESCERNWEANGEHCYLWSTDKKNWTEAEDFCRKEGGHLASVHSNATFAFVLEGMNRTGLEMAWLGGNDIEEEGTWKWVDCSPWNVTFWGNSEPNNAGGAEHCLHHVFNYPPFPSYLYHKWNDEGCRREQGFLCSKSICSGVSEHSVSDPTESAVSAVFTVSTASTESAVTGANEKSVSEPTVSAVTGDSVMWKPASISLAGTLLLLLIVFL